MRCFLLLLIFLPLYVCANSDTSFVIVICSYNNQQWYKKNLSSVFMQDYTNYRVVYTDDNSIDNTSILVEQFIDEQNKSEVVQVIKNTNRIGQLANTYNAILGCKKTDVVIILDGDDWFARSDVLSYLNTIYSDKNVWLTYGQYRQWPSNKIGHCSKLSKNVIEQNLFRQSKWAASHLRSFYAGLFHEINVEDLKFDGEFIKYSADAAYMFPLLEMAGNHIRFISKVLYIYNRDNPLNCNKQKMKLSLEMFDFVKHKEKYTPLAFMPEE